MERLPDVRVPDVVGEIIAFRAWKVIGDNPSLPMLASVTHGTTIWHPGHWTLATCNGRDYCPASKDHGIPGESCSCGLYAALDREHLVTKMGYGREHQNGPPVFVGEVALSGKVIPGTQGWRAERGRIARLFVPFHHWKLVEPLEELYGIPVQLDNTQKTAPSLGADWR